MREPVACVVGAGPAGLAVAGVLQRAGVSYVLLERLDAAQLRAQTKAGMIEHRTVELLRLHGMAESILERGTKVGMCEFRTERDALVFDYASLCGGRGHFIYPQHELVVDWVDELLARGGDVRLGVEATGVDQDHDGARVQALEISTGAAFTIESEIVVCCDGATGAFAGDLEDVSLSHRFRWLTLIAAAPPSSEGTIYGIHRRGFSGQMHRSSAVTRFVLEVSLDDRVDDWPDDRLWAELHERLDVTGRAPIEEGELLERDVLVPRVRVREPMQHGRVFFAGDAAHLITPAGGKGMNIAIQDAVELACGIGERYGGTNAGTRLANYSATRLPHVWRQQEFSNLMLSILCAGAGLGDSAFSYALRRARLDQVLNEPQFSRWFARAYVGVDD